MSSELITCFHRVIVHGTRWGFSSTNHLVDTLSRTGMTLGSRSLSTHHRHCSQPGFSAPRKVGSCTHPEVGRVLPGGRKRMTCRCHSTMPDTTGEGSREQSKPLSGTASGSGKESTLYLRHGDSSNAAVVDVDLGLETSLADPKVLRNDIQRRGLQAHIDVDQLITDFNKFSEMKREEETLEAGRDRVSNEVKVLVKQQKKSPDFEERKKALMVEGKNLREKLKLLHDDIWGVEADVMLAALRLPIPLAVDTPDEDEVVDELGDVPDDSAVTPFSELDKTLYFTSSMVNPGAVYLQGAASRLELDVVDSMSMALRRGGMTQFACPDMTKAVIMEGCGEDFTDPRMTLTLQQKAADIVEPGVNKWDLLLGLCGGAALPAIISYLCKMNVSRTSLPLKWFSVGRRYTPATDVSTDVSSLLRASQATQVSVFGAGPTPQDADQLYRDYVSTLWELYTMLGIPLRRVRVGAQKLLHSQSAATRIEAWLPSEQKYIKVAGVGVYEDFVSRRLMIKWADEVNDIYRSKYLHMVYGTALDVPRLLAVLLESGTFPP